MSGLFTRDLPSSLSRIEDAAYAIGMVAKYAASDTPESTYSLAGRLVVTPSNWGMLELPNALVRGLFDALHEPGVELPLKDGNLRAHITVFRPEDIEKIGGADRITERGRFFRFQLGPLKVVKPKGWEGVSAVYLVSVNAPELRQLRRSYGLSPLPNENHEFHITIACRRAHVLHDNPTSKAAREPRPCPFA